MEYLQIPCHCKPGINNNLRSNIEVGGEGGGMTRSIRKPGCPIHDAVSSRHGWDLYHSGGMPGAPFMRAFLRMGGMHSTPYFFSPPPALGAAAGTPYPAAFIREIVSANAGFCISSTQLGR